MALIESIPLPIGAPLAHFDLKDPFGTVFSSQKAYQKDIKGLLIAFTCNHCPYAVAVWPRLIQCGQYAQENEIVVVAINPNIHPGYLEDAPEAMKEKIEEWGIPFPYLVDEAQEVAKEFKAQCTPDIYLFDAKQKLFYHGRIDDNWQDELAVKKEELKEAMDLLIAGQNPPEKQYPTLGCSIKWR